MTLAEIGKLTDYQIIAIYCRPEKKSPAEGGMSMAEAVARARARYPAKPKPKDG